MGEVKTQPSKMHSTGSGLTLGVTGIPENLMKMSLLPRDGNTHTHTHTHTHTLTHTISESIA